MFYPILFGTLIWLAEKRGNKGFSLEGVVVYRETLPIRKQLFWTLAILVLTAIVWFSVLPIGNWLEPYFSWVPKSDEAYAGDFSVSIIAITFAFNVLCTAIIGPLGEELYYRGYLLPRMPKQFGRAAPLVHSFLFAVHHVHSPWLIITRTIGLLPLIYVTRFTRSLVPAILAHQFVNGYSLVEWALVGL